MHDIVSNGNYIDVMRWVGNRENGLREEKTNSDRGQGILFYQETPPDTMDRRLIKHSSLFFIILAVIV